MTGRYSPYGELMPFFHAIPFRAKSVRIILSGD